MEEIGLTLGGGSAGLGPCKAGPATSDGRMLCSKFVTFTGPSAQSSKADDISLDVQEGEALGIIGPNGAGKSSLFNLITGRLTPQSGTIALDGQDITAMAARKRVHAGIGRQLPDPAALRAHDDL
jgi:ABC-type uncharacterized transport system ATPase subunit